MVKVELKMREGLVELELRRGQYQSNRMAIQLIYLKTGEPWIVLTVNLPENELGVDEFFVKTWSENTETTDALLDQTDLFVDTLQSIPVGFVDASVWKFADPKTFGKMREL